MACWKLVCHKYKDNITPLITCTLTDVNSVQTFYLHPGESIDDAIKKFKSTGCYPDSLSFGYTTTGASNLDISFDTENNTVTFNTELLGQYGPSIRSLGKNLWTRLCFCSTIQRSVTIDAHNVVAYFLYKCIGNCLTQDIVVQVIVVVTYIDHCMVQR